MEAQIEPGQTIVQQKKIAKSNVLGKTHLKSCTQQLLDKHSKLLTLLANLSSVWLSVCVFINLRVSVSLGSLSKFVSSSFHNIFKR